MGKPGAGRPVGGDGDGLTKGHRRPGAVGARYYRREVHGSCRAEDNGVRSGTTRERNAECGMAGVERGRLLEQILRLAVAQWPPQLPCYSSSVGTPRYAVLGLAIIASLTGCSSGPGVEDRLTPGPSAAPLEEPSAPPLEEPSAPPLGGSGGAGSMTQDGAGGLALASTEEPSSSSCEWLEEQLTTFETLPEIQERLAFSDFLQPEVGTFTDERDGRCYRWVEINGVRWMAESLAYEIPEVWGMTRVDNLPTSPTEGLLYNWSAVVGAPLITTYLPVELPPGRYQGICPDGWRVPSAEDWAALLEHVGATAGLPPSENGLYPYAAVPLSTPEWPFPGTNHFRFGVSPMWNGVAGFWTLSPVDATRSTAVHFFDGQVGLPPYPKEEKMALRCIAGQADARFPKVTLPAPANVTTSMTDPRDGQTYATVQIGEQNWMAENLNYATQTGSMCLADQAEHCDLFGRLYRFEAAQTACPPGWRLPGTEDWDALGQYVDSQAGGAGVTDDSLSRRWIVAEHLIHGEIWKDPAPNQELAFGFNALAAGAMLSPTRVRLLPHGSALFWSSSSNQVDPSRSRSGIANMAVRFYVGLFSFSEVPDLDEASASVRCMKD